jgi:hypothetical protein
MGFIGGSRGSPEPGVTFEARWDILAHRPVDVGHGVMLPEQFIARFIRKDDHTVEMDIATLDGAPVCNALRVFRHPDRPSLSGHELRRFPIAEWVRYACSMVGVGNQGGVQTTSEEWQTEAYRADVERVVPQARRRSRNTITDEFLREVARTYRANADSAPIDVIREVHGQGGYVAYGTAARWVRLARERGFLPPTTQGRVAI